MNVFAAALVASLMLAGAPGKGPLKPGDRAPEFRLRTIDGEMVRLDELAYPGKEKSYAKKRPLFLDFFRTDCQPCKNAMPQLLELHKKYSAQGMEVVLIALLEEGDGKAKLEKYVAEHKLPFRIVVDDNEHFAKKYLGDPVTLPATFLVDESGTLKKAKYGASGTYEEYFGADIASTIAKWKGK